MILGTAGHIDHGKTALVRALTGVDTDRLPEEKRRGITIELGFAPLRLDGVGTIGIVDVPGHEAFVRTMLAGASGIDLALLVIAADEGIMPQTREHLTILDLLGVRGGVIALTKMELVDADWIQLIESDVRALVAGTALADAPIIPVSAHAGTGLDELRAALTREAAAIPARDTRDIPRMPIDRVFSVKGIGTVVTGTLWSGALTADDEVRIFSPSLAALGRVPLRARVRSVESHGQAQAAAAPGNRTAIALGGIDRDEIPHGSTLVSDGDLWIESKTLRADVALLAGVRPVGVRTKLRLHIGTVEVGARIVAIGGAVAGDARTPVRVTLEAPIIARSGDRFVLRSASPSATIGGGVITDPAPLGRRPKPWSEAGADSSRCLELIVEEAAGRGMPVNELPVRIGIAPDTGLTLIRRARSVTAVGDRLFSVRVRKARTLALAALVRGYHESHSDEPGLPIESARREAAVHETLFDDIVREAVAQRKLELQGARLARPGFTPSNAAAEKSRLDELESELVRGGETPPDVTSLTVRFGGDTLRLLRILARSGRAVEVVSDRFYAPQSVKSQLDRIAAGNASGMSVTASQVREMLGLSRKYVIPFLEYCDRQGISVRDGDFRTFRWELAQSGSRPPVLIVP